MCKRCRMDERDVAIRNLRQGGYDVADFADEFRHVPKKKSPSKKTRSGCPGNEYRAHVYIWTSETEEGKDFFFKHFGFHRYERKVCIGCRKVAGSRNSAKYEEVKRRKWRKMYGDLEFEVKRGEPVPRRRRYTIDYSYWAWERYDDAYVEAKRKHAQALGLSAYWWYASL